MTTAYSSGAYSDQKIATTDLHNECTVHHTGTSAAAPLVAGVVALVLEANPNLTWRDVQHLVVWHSESHHLRHNKGWRRNSAGLMYNSRFGFGLINAEAMVKAALNWTHVPEKAICKVEASSKLPEKISSHLTNEVEVEIASMGCIGTSDEINYLEHVELTLDIDYTHRGALDIYLFSPAGTVSMLLSRRERDSSATGFKDWTFSSVHFWGENPTGKWKVLVRDLTSKDYKGAINSMNLTLHGTKVKPEHMSDGQKKYKNEDLMERAIDKTPEYEEENPAINNNLPEKLENLRSIKNEKELTWNDLIDNGLQMSPPKMNRFIEDPNLDINLEDDSLDYYLNLYSDF